KGEETAYLRERIEALGGQAMLFDIGVVGEAAVPADVTREAIADAGGRPLAEILANPTRQDASPVMVAGATKLLRERLDDGTVHAVLGLGGTQGTSNCTQIMQALPYGVPKVMVSTVASGDTARTILANAAGAAWGMACADVTLADQKRDKPLVGMTNLGVLTEGAMHAVELFRQAGYETIVFHAVGSGGRAMEQMMKEGIIGAVFDYALGEISDEMYDGLRAGGAERLTVAGSLGLPQVICPGGAEHIGLMVEANTVPEPYRDHLHVFHNPIILAPRLNADEFRAVAREVATRLGSTSGHACFMMPTRGTSRYGIAGGPLHDPAGDAAFLDELRQCLPESVELVEVDLEAEDPAFVKQAVDRLIAMME
ncbi:MAG: Tm-1-like ATP-binding domain-containing protein, partial [Planctomycetota bacterium]